MELTFVNSSGIAAQIKVDENQCVEVLKKSASTLNVFKANECKRVFINLEDVRYITIK